MLAAMFRPRDCSKPCRGGITTRVGCSPAGLPMLRPQTAMSSWSLSTATADIPLSSSNDFGGCSKYGSASRTPSVGRDVSRPVADGRFSTLYRSTCVLLTHASVPLFTKNTCGLVASCPPKCVVIIECCIVLNSSGFRPIVSAVVRGHGFELYR